MADPPNVPRVEDPLAALRRSIERHQQVTQAAVQTGQQLRGERTPPPASEPEQA